MDNPSAPGSYKNPLLVPTLNDGFFAAEFSDYDETPIHVWITTGEQIGERWRIWLSGRSELMEIADPGYIEYRLAGGKDE